MSIRELIEAVENRANPSETVPLVAAVFPDRQHAKWVFMVLDDVFAAFSAALALMAAVLPGVPVSLHDETPEYLGGHGWVAKVNWPHVVWQPTFTATGPFAHEGRDDTPARALLLAILKAMEVRASVQTGEKP